MENVHDLNQRDSQGQSEMFLDPLPILKKKCNSDLNKMNRNKQTKLIKLI